VARQSGCAVRPHNFVNKRSLFIGCTVFLATAAASLWLHDAQAQAHNAGRDEWQRPAEVMDTLHINAGTQVADVGCGEGYFVLHLAKRVGAQGRVYAVDIDEDSLGKAKRAVEEDGLTNVLIVRSKANDATLPAATLDVVLTVNAYHEMREYDAMLRSIRAALKPGGLLAVIDATGDAERDRSRLADEHTITEALVREDAARNGFRFRSKERGFHNPQRRREWFFLIFEKPATPRQQ